MTRRWWLTVTMPSAWSKKHETYVEVNKALSKSLHKRVEYKGVSLGKERTKSIWLIPKTWGHAYYEVSAKADKIFKVPRASIGSRWDTCWSREVPRWPAITYALTDKKPRKLWTDAEKKRRKEEIAESKQPAHAVFGRLYTRTLRRSWYNHEASVYMICERKSKGWYRGLEIEIYKDNNKLQYVWKDKKFGRNEITKKVESGQWKYNDASFLVKYGSPTTIVQKLVDKNVAYWTKLQKTYQAAPRDKEVTRSESLKKGEQLDVPSK